MISMCVRVWYFGEAVPWALGVNRFIFVPGYAAAWSMRSLSTSRPLFSAFAFAPWCLVDSLTSRQEAFAVFSGSNVSGITEYPHFGNFYFSDCAINSVKAIYMAFRNKTSAKIKWTSLVPFFEGELRAVRCTVYE